MEGMKGPWLLMNLLALMEFCLAMSQVLLPKKSTGMWSPFLAPMGSSPWSLPSFSWKPRQQILGGPSK